MSDSVGVEGWKMAEAGTPEGEGGVGGAERVLNVNVGVLGHVDSGKTSLGVCCVCEVMTCLCGVHHIKLP